MLLACESCETSFRVSAAEIGLDGRFVRCIKCGYEWLANANQDDIRDEIAQNDKVINEDVYDDITSNPKNVADYEKENLETNSEKSNGNQRYTTEFYDGADPDNLRENQPTSNKISRLVLPLLLIGNAMVLGILLLLYNSDRIITEYPQISEVLHKTGLYHKDIINDGIIVKAFNIKQNDDRTNTNSPFEMILANRSEKIILIRNIKLVVDNSGKKAEYDIPVHKIIRPRTELQIPDINLKHDSIVSVYINNSLIVYKKRVG